MYPRDILWVCMCTSLLAGCVGRAVLQPDDLELPSRVTCIDLQEPLVYQDDFGPFNVVLEHRFERGPYIAERIDDEGTYYRGPPGAYVRMSPSMKSQWGGKEGLDGGFFIPHDPDGAPRIYYYMNGSVPIVVPPKSAQCTSLAYVKDPQGKKLDVGLYGLAGGLGGISGRLQVSGAPISYGQVAGAGFVSGIIIATLINMDLGKISLDPPLRRPEVIARFKKLTDGAVLIRSAQQ